ncbi:MAG: hypothetical protein ACLQUY_28095 [Ktedonobacterales bacterium]
MSRHTDLLPHLTTDELEGRYRAAKDQPRTHLVADPLFVLAHGQAAKTADDLPWWRASTSGYTELGWLIIA